MPTTCKHICSRLFERTRPISAGIQSTNRDKAVPAGEHRGRFNAPVDADEITVIFDTDKVKFPDLILNLKCKVLF